MKRLQLQMRPIEELLPAEENPRTITAKARRKLRESLQRFGLVEPLVWNRRSGRVVGGHQRLAILRELGRERVPVSVVDLDDSEEKALNIVLNNLEAQGRYDTAKLAALLGQLDPVIGLSATGFDASMLRSLTLLPPLVPPSEPPSAAVEVILRCEETVYNRLAPALDRIVHRHQVESHVRRLNELPTGRRSGKPARQGADRQKRSRD